MNTAHATLAVKDNPFSKYLTCECILPPQDKPVVDSRNAVKRR
jgi:hypothetical protein